MPSVIEVYGHEPTVQVYPTQVTYNIGQMCLKIESDYYRFAPFLANNSYGLHQMRKHRAGDATGAYPINKTGVLWDGSLIKRIYRYTHEQLMGELKRRATAQRTLFPLPNAKFLVHYGEGHLAYANDTTGYEMAFWDVLHIFTKRQGNYPDKLFAYAEQAVYYMDEGGRLVTLVADAIERIKQLDASVFADPFVWLEETVNGDKLRRTTVFEGTPVRPPEEESNGEAQ